MQTVIDARLDLEPLYPGAPAHLPKNCRRPEPVKVSAAPIGSG
jgi:hypothetical protein